MPAPLLVTFAAGDAGPWRIERIVPVIGEALPAALRLSMTESGDATATRATWQLHGTTSNLRYTRKDEAAALAATQEGLARPQATCAALIPIKKSEAWWALAQDERRSIMEERSRHIAIGMETLPQVSRRLHHCRDLGGESFDFLTWFEFAPEHTALFDEMVGKLRASEEWNYVEREFEVRVMRKVSGDVLLVGSIPYDSVEEVFDTFGAKLGAHLHALPDGEVGLRSHWVSRIHYQVLAIHPDLEVVQRPRMDNGRERLNPHDATDSWQFRVRKGVTKIRFGDAGWRLGFARDAINSFFVFKTKQEKGELPKHLRMQVSIPMIASMAPPRIFPQAGDVEIVREALTDALRDEVATLVAKIPNERLAIQFDCVAEVQDAYGATTKEPRDAAIARNMQQIAAIVPAIPEQVAVGYHFCFGTLGGWPRFAPADLGGAVDLANAVVVASGRRVDWVHIPVLDSPDDAFYAPLAKLKPNGARVYLGAVHNMDGYAARVAAARKYIPDFGVGAYCGFGREKPETLPKILEDHVKAVEAP